jgi:hypothetical protein
MLTSFIFHLFRKKTCSSPLSTYFLNITFVESFDVSYTVYINTIVNIMEETSSNDRIKNNELGVELRKIKIKLGSFVLFTSLYQEWRDYKITNNMHRDQNDWKFSRLRVT